MTITKKQSGSTLTVSPAGSLDAMTSPGFEEELKASLDGVEKLILDCGKIEYVSSAGLRAFIAAEKVMSDCGGMKLINVREPFRGILKLTGLDKFLDVEYADGKEADC